MGASVKVSIPEEMIKLLDATGDDLEARVRETLLLHLFHQGAVSSRKAAELLGISWDAFLDLLREHEIPYFDMTEEELLEDLRVAREARTSRKE